MPEAKKNVLYNVSPFTDYDTLLFREGNFFRAYEKLGAHPRTTKNKKGTHFSVWAPNAKSVSIIGNFNKWNPKAHPLKARPEGSGVWEGFIPEVLEGELYKFHIISNHNKFKVDKSDPYAFYWEIPPGTSSRVWSLDYRWGDNKWMKSRSKRNSLNAPISIYELHLGSWRRDAKEKQFPAYQEIKEPLTEYVKKMGFTHVEFLPLMEHPFYGSWGYEPVGFFAPTSRYGSPQDLMSLVDHLHQNDIGVILDWVPCHFPLDEHGPVYFDGTHLYEHEDPKKSFQPDWGCDIFNYGRNEVRNFLVSNALFWLDKYHVDGLRMDAVSSMLYLDYGRKKNEWIPNEKGGRENIEAIEFLKNLNKTIYANYPDVVTIAEESTAWPSVSRPVDTGGLGFGLKWNMGWMHDVLSYFSKDPLYRKHHHDQLTFSLEYAFTENFILPFSHDELVYGKRSLIGRMPGDNWQKFANLRLLLGLMFAHPGKKMLFMGSEFAQWKEWNHDTALDWELLKCPAHQGIQSWVKDLNRLYRKEPSLYEMDFKSEGFQWIDCKDQEKSIISFIRKGKNKDSQMIAVCNFAPEVRSDYKIGVPKSGLWEEVLNSDAKEYGGSGQGNLGRIKTKPISCHGMGQSLPLTLPPLGIIILKTPKTKKS